MRRLGFAFVAFVSLVIVAPVAAQSSVGSATLYAVDLGSGRLSAIGTIGDGDGDAVVGFAVVDGATTTIAYALTTDGRILTFNPSTPGTIANEQTVTGLVAGDALIGIDVRPATGELYGLGGASYVYLVDAGTGIASAVGGAFSPALEGSAFGFDFNPTVDRIRVVSNSGQNLRLNPDTGQVVTNPDTGAPTVDGRLAYAAGDANEGAAPAAVGAGYTNSFAGAESTVLYDIDATQDVLVTQAPPNDGVLNAVGTLGVDATGLLGLDITASGAAYATITPAVRLPDTGAGTATGAASIGAGSAFAVLAAGAFAACGVRARRA